MSILSKELQTQIDEWAKRYPPDQRQSALLTALMLAQKSNQGHLTNELIEAVADHLGIPTIAAYEVATFYTMYNLKSVGHHRIDVCTNISCLLMGSDEVVAHLKKRLGIGFNETTPDGKFTLKEVECLAACAGGPACQIGPHYYESLTPAKIDALLDELEGKKHG